MSKVNGGGGAIERVARSLYEMVNSDDDSDGEIEFMPQPHAAAASASAGAFRPTTRLPHRRGTNATRAARVVHRNNRSSTNAAAGGGSHSASSSPAKSNNSCSPRRDSNQRIKELVLSQFDLIKKQSDDIVRKDQQLRDLQRDNEKLKARLKLLELKNVEHEKKTKLRPPGRHTQSTETELRDCVDKDLNVQRTPPAADFATKEEAQASSSKRQKRRSALAPAATVAGSSVPKTKRAKSSSSQSEEEAKTARSPEFVSAARPFFVLEGEDFVKREKEEVKSILRFAEVPGWREKTVPAATSRTTSAAASEATDDDSYLKRHGKPELEERRRKRWDMQRIREQRHIERLKARYDQANAATAVAAPAATKPPALPARTPVACKGKGGDRCCQLGACLLEGGRTLMNDPLGITHVHVLTPAEERENSKKGDDVPVSVFGHRIPELTSSSSSSTATGKAGGHFQLPWTKSAG